MNAILIHGMGRGRGSMWLLGHRLRQSGMLTRLFGYSARSPFAAVVERLARDTATFAGDAPFIMIGHSLGSVLIRAALTRLAPLAPVACYFIAPPSRPSRMARYFVRFRLFRRLTGEMSARLSSDEFMASLPVPPMPFIVFAGTAGPRGRLSPFGSEPNDGILSLSETRLGNAPPVEVKALHTLIMNSRAVSRWIIGTAQSATPFPGSG